MKKVLVFGVFDGMHAGHRAFFKEAKKLGDYLIAVVAQDHIVEYLKGRLPSKNLVERLDDLKREKLVDETALGDAELSSYEVIKKCRPEVIVLGYDQDVLKKDLERHLKDFDWQPKIVVAGPHEPGKYKSSLLNKGYRSK